MVNTLDTLTDKSVTWDTVRHWVIDTYREVVEHAEKLGIIMAMENHFGATRTTDNTLTVVRQVDSPWFKVNIDTGNFYEEIRYGDDFVKHTEILEHATPFEDVYEGIDRLAREQSIATRRYTSSMLKVETMCFRTTIASWLFFAATPTTDTCQ